MKSALPLLDHLEPNLAKVTHSQEHARLMHGKKMSSFEEAAKDKEFEITFKAYKALPRFSQAQQRVTKPMDELAYSRHMVFILVLNNDREVLVNTEGYTYSRYCAGFTLVEDDQ